MSILIAEDDSVSRRLLEEVLRRWGHAVEVVTDGTAAWEALSRPVPPRLAVLDWVMPGVDGLTLCRRVRALERPDPTYLILLTARSESADVVAGLDAGADDYLTKPFRTEELRARVGVGLRVAVLQRSLAERVVDLESALARMRQLQGLLPICSYCKSIRTDGDYWQRVEEYLAAHTEARFTHGVCPTCLKTILAEMGLPPSDGTCEQGAL
jgi:DNA-binding response OmpR family regulator